MTRRSRLPLPTLGGSGAPGRESVRVTRIDWMRAIPSRTWVLLGVAIVLPILALIVSIESITSQRDGAVRSASLATAREESVSVGQTIDGIVATVASPADSPDPVESVRSSARTITLSLDHIVDSGVPSTTVEESRRSVEALTDVSLEALATEDPPPALADRIQDAGRQAKASVARLSTALARTQDALVDHASNAYLWSLLAALSVPLVTLGCALIAISLLNRRIRDEVVQLGSTLEDVGAVRFPAGLDTRNGPLHSALSAPFDTMIEGLRITMAQLRSTARQSDVGLAIADSMKDIKDRTDLSGAVSQALAKVSDTMPGELIAISPDGSRMLRTASNPLAGAPGCPVSSPGYCPALRSREPLVFSDSSAPDACPNLRARGVRCSALCVPVTSGNYSLGVLHLTAPRSHQLDQTLIGHATTLAGLTATRLTHVAAFEATHLRATTDQLTGLANRRTFEERVQDLLTRNIPFILVMSDLDHFKRLNDSFGHDTGDQVLKVFARVLRENVRRSDLAARFGGEEFLVLLPDTSMTEALVTLDRVRVALGTTLGVNGLPRVTASFGVTRSLVGASLEELLRVADAGLYEAKERGRDCVVEATTETVANVFGEDGERRHQPNV